jgi:hypothetical protein
METIVVLATFTLLLCGGLAMGYAVFAHVWLERSTYEASICLATPANQRDCERALRDSVAAALPIGQIVKIDLRRTPAEASVKLLWRFHHGFGDGIQFEVKDTRQLPLLKRKWRWRIG